MRSARHVFFIALAAAGSLASADETIADGQPLVCSASSVIAQFGDKVTLTSAPVGRNDELQWAATGGTIEGHGTKATWLLKSLPADQNSQTAFALSTSLDGTRRVCSVEVWLSADPLKGTIQETGRAFLQPNQHEEEGFGLYSYLVLGSPVNSQNRALYEAVMAAYLERVRELVALRKYFSDQSRLAAMYVPVTAPPPANGKVSAAEAAKWFVDHYDGERMRAMVNRLPQRLSDGPYLVSSLRPLGDGPLAIQLNLGFITEDMAGLWVKEFLAATAQEHSWGVQNLRMFTLKTRTLLAILAANIPDIKRSLQEWLTFGDMGGKGTAADKK